jgi:5-methyltetrahydropteroyltriglutamate--homocysteine methyltransferase
MGVNRDLKKATENYWAGKISQDELLAEAKRLRLAHWKIQKDAGVDSIPSNDFALYDQVLTHIQDFGVSNIITDSGGAETNVLPGCPREIHQEQPEQSR